MSGTVTIDAIGQRGDGVATVDGRSVFVPRAAAGDRLRITVDDTKDIAFGRIDEIIEAGPGRIQAPCPHYDSCGGCQLQHINEETYRAWKENSVRQQFEGAGIAPDKWLESVFIPHATRRRVTFAAIKQGQALTLGFNGYRSDAIVDLGVCLLLTPALDDLRKRMRPHLLKILPEGKLTDVSLQDIDGATEMILTGEFGEVGVSRSAAITEAVHALGLARIGWRPKQLSAAEALLQIGPVKKSFGKLIVEVPPAAFLQPSGQGEAALTQAVLAGCKDMKKKRFLDLFSGCGTFSGPLLAQGTVHAVESDRPSTDALKKAMAHAQGLSVERRDLFREPVTTRELNQYDCVVFDPPRAGAKAQAAVIAKSKVPRVIGVSCNPGTFITDAKLLIEGGYRLKSVQIVDQFIWSAHSEVIGVFSRD